MSIDEYSLLGRVVAIGSKNDGRKFESRAIMHLLHTNITRLNASTEGLEFRDQEFAHANDILATRGFAADTVGQKEWVLISVGGGRWR